MNNQLSFLPCIFVILFHNEIVQGIETKYDENFQEIRLLRS